MELEEIQSEKEGAWASILTLSIPPPTAVVLTAHRNLTLLRLCYTGDGVGTRRFLTCVTCRTSVTHDQQRDVV
jgi:hypothetical protein